MDINRISKFKSIVSLIFLAGCAANPNLPTDHFFSSENNGTGKSKILIGAAGGNKLVVIDDYLSSTIIKNPQIKKSTTPKFSYTYGLNDWFNIESSIGPNTPLYLGGNLQLIGSPYSSASQFNFSLSLRVWSSAYVTGKSYTLVNGQKRSAIVSGFSNGFSPSIGFRIIDSLLFYIYYTQETFGVISDISGDITEEAHADGHQSHLGAGFDYLFGEYSVGLIINKTEASLERDSKDSIDGLRFSLLFGSHF